MFCKELFLTFLLIAQIFGAIDEECNSFVCALAESLRKGPEPMNRKDIENRKNMIRAFVSLIDNSQLDHFDNSVNPDLDSNQARKVAKHLLEAQEYRYKKDRQKGSHKNLGIAT